MPPASATRAAASSAWCHEYDDPSRRHDLTDVMRDRTQLADDVGVGGLTPDDLTA
jgi:hypothetical protein